MQRTVSRVVYIVVYHRLVFVGIKKFFQFKQNNGNFRKSSCTSVLISKLFRSVLVFSDALKLLQQNNGDVICLDLNSAERPPLFLPCRGVNQVSCFFLRRQF